MSIVSGIWQAEATKSAASTQAAASDKAAQLQYQMYLQGRQDTMPWLTTGAQSLNRLQQLIAAGPGGRPAAGIAPTGIPSTISYTTEQAPGYAPPGQGAVPTVQGGTSIPPRPTQIPWGKWGPPQQNEEDWPNYESALKLAQKAWDDQYNGGVPPTPGQPGVAQPGGQPGVTQPGGLLSSPTATPWETVPYTDYAKQYEESPYYEFLLGEGTKALERGAAARGKQFSGAQGKALTQYGQGLASTDYNNWLSNWYQSLQPYQSLAGLGMTTGMQGAAQGNQAAGNIANTLLQGGQAQAAGQLGVGNIYSGMIRNTGQNALNAYMANKQNNPYGGITSPYDSYAQAYGAYGGYGYDSDVSAYDYYSTLAGSGL